MDEGFLVQSEVDASDWSTRNAWAATASEEREGPGKLTLHHVPLIPTIANGRDGLARLAYDTKTPRTPLHIEKIDHYASIRAQDSVGSWQHGPFDEHPLAHLSYDPSEWSGGAAAAWHPWPSGIGDALADAAGAGPGCVEGGCGGGALWGTVVSCQVSQSHLSYGSLWEQNARMWTGCARGPPLLCAKRTGAAAGGRGHAPLRGG